MIKVVGPAHDYEDHLYLKCDCGDLTNHLVVFSYDRELDDKYDCTNFSIQLSKSHFLPWYKRIIPAIKYVFSRSQIGYYNISLGDKQVSGLVSWLKERLHD